jgi:glycerophosphoryl diester phosphodiesterase
VNQTNARRIEVIGHGGAADFYPGNSQESLETAIALGVDRIEIDVRAIGDGTLVLHHDAEIRDDGQARPLAALSVADLRSLRPDILLLDEAIEITRPSATPLLVDIKERSHEGKLVETFRAHRIDTTCSVSSTHARSLRLIKIAIPGIRAGLSRGHALTKVSHPRVRRMATPFLSSSQIAPLLSVARWSGATEVMLQHHICTPHLVRAVKQAGFGVYPWTVNHLAEIRTLLGIGVDGIISNRPDLVQLAIRERG